MNTFTVNQLISISDLQRDYSYLVEKAKKMAVPFFLLRRNKPEAILVSIPAYEEMAKKSRLYEERLAMEAIEEFEEDRKTGKLLIGKTGSDLLKFEKKINETA